MTTSKEGQSLKNLILIISELLGKQAEIGDQENFLSLLITTKV